MKINHIIYNFVLKVTTVFIISGCSSTIPIAHVAQVPLDNEYDRFLHYDSKTVENINAYTRYIDSLAEYDKSQELIIKSIVEGKVNHEIVTTSVIGHKNKIDTIRESKTGGFGKYTIENINGDTVYKILYHDNVEKNFYETHYYKDNKLIYSKIDYQEDGIGQTFYFKEEYYQSNKILLTNESPKPTETVFRQRVTFDLRKKGEVFLEEFQLKRH